MKKIFLAIIFVLGFFTVGFSQTPTAVPTVDLGSSVTTVIGTEARLNSITIQVSDNGLADTTVQIFASIGKTSTTDFDPETGLFLFDTVKTQLVFEGKISQLLALVTASATEEAAHSFAVEFVKTFYDKNSNSGLIVQFNALVQLLKASGKLDIQPEVKKVVQ